MQASRINADFDRRVALPPPGAGDWVNSPMAGVTRRMLDRVGGEVARATSLVRYAPASRFDRHEHGGGEGILVLEGLFQDEYDAYPAVGERIAVVGYLRPGATELRTRAEFVLIGGRVYPLRSLPA